MARCARLFRTMGGLFLLADITVLFLPVLVIRQDNYPTIRYSQFDFIKQLFMVRLSSEQMAVIIAFILLPAFLALIFGVIGVVGSERQIVSCIGSILVAGLQGAFCLNMNVLEPERINEAQKYQKDLFLWIFLGISIAAAFCGVLGMIATPRRKKRLAGIPEGRQGTEIRPHGQDVAGENLVKERQEIKETVADKVPEVPVQPVAKMEARGVMVGLSGDYQGAEIPFRDGETLKIGRDVSNDLIFSNAERISRFHCSLTWIAEKQKFQIVDKSSNGSFINGLEECIPQNIAIYLEPGTILDLGNAQNRFRLE